MSKEKNNNANDSLVFGSCNRNRTGGEEDTNFLPQRFCTSFVLDEDVNDGELLLFAALGTRVDASFVLRNTGSNPFDYEIEYGSETETGTLAPGSSIVRVVENLEEIFVEIAEEDDETAEGELDILVFNIG
ncbi:hypothetical protein ACOJQI_02465 [Bacillus salacetis]|uniref:hypothetical protein n=1 Tax=Bacillus salacetis TaxID=2315464 RepID=UPI003BA0C83C